jgi:hypothetical protein
VPDQADQPTDREEEVEEAQGAKRTRDCRQNGEHLHEGGGNRPNPDQRTVAAGVLKAACPQSRHRQEQSKSDDRSKQARANDGVDNGRRDIHDESRKHEVPEFLPADAAFQVEIVFGQVAAKYFDNGLWIHDSSPRCARARRLTEGTQSNRGAKPLIPREACSE